MAETGTEHQAEGLAPDNADAANAQQAALFSASEGQRHKRTVGLRLFDAFLYPFLTNFGVFGLSVVATYLTNKGSETNAEGKLIYGRVGKFFQKRGEWLEGKFVKWGMSQNAAGMSKMVFFSFADGTLFAPMVKLFEDRREKIAEWIDNRLGTAPADKSAYEAEPKETWGSVLAGRGLTSAIVVPVAAVLQTKGWNQKMFEERGLRWGGYVADKPRIINLFSKLKVPQKNISEVFKIGVFEAFYTSVCTAGLYFISRFIARKHTWETVDQPPAASHQVFTALADTAPAAAALATAPPATDAPTPRPQVAQMHYVERMAPSPELHVTA